MCAYDVDIAAPKATLLDYAVLLSQAAGRDGHVGPAVRRRASPTAACSRIKTGSQRRRRAPMVVSNSWGMFSPSWDFPVGHPGNYSDNPAHPFNVIVGSLEAAGADILFAAGNCGRDCPDGRCAVRPTAAGRPVCGANSHPRCCSVAGVDVTRTRGPATPPRGRGGSTAAEAGPLRLHPLHGLRRLPARTAAPRPPARSRPGWWRRSAARWSVAELSPAAAAHAARTRRPSTWAAPATITTMAGASSTPRPWSPPGRAR